MGNDRMGDVCIMSTSIRNHHYIYHLTAFENMKSILQYGLLPRKQLQENTFTDVADPQIMAYREDYHLDDYVPFHFFINSPFAVNVMRNYPGKYVYIAVNRGYAAMHNFKIIPEHPMSSPEKYNVQMYSYAEGFELIDWETMDKRDFCNQKSKQVCMAECLCKGKLDIHQLIRSGSAGDGRNLILFYTNREDESEKSSLEQLYHQLFPTEWRLPGIIPAYFPK